MQLINLNNLEALKSFSSNSIDSIVTDPPYGISFMGKKWDYDVPSVETWKECMRVLKPGGHILVACGTRTQHRMTVNIEDAGFEIRDIVAWIYGSGFPKSLNIGKAINKIDGVEFIAKPASGVGFMNNDKEDGYHPTINQLEQIGESSERAKDWEGWGTALKPAMELWTMARKPLSEKNIAENVLKWGTGGINIDGSRVEYVNAQDYDKAKWGGAGKPPSKASWKQQSKIIFDTRENNGRFPANVIHDGSDEVTDLFPNDSQRFFYCAKASKSERNDGTDKNNHPTVKPVALMRYLVKMITPTGGMVLDPFMGSGSTGVACMKENFSFTGIELDQEYFKIAEARINNQLV